MNFFKIFLMILFGAVNLAFADQITLKECLKKAEVNSPLKKQFEFYKSSTDKELINYNSNWLPKFQIEGQGTYQSDVFQLPFTLPAFKIDVPSNAQYKMSLNVNQMIYDGGTTSELKTKSLADYNIAGKSVEVNLFKVKDNVVKLYFAVLTLQENVNIIKNGIARLESDKQKFNVMFQNGTTTKGTINKFDLEIEKLNQKLNSVLSDKESVIKSLSELTGANLNSFKFISPENDNISYSKLNRPELDLMDYQQQTADAGKNINETALLPKVFGFVQGGVASPHPFNMFKTGSELFYITGIKFSWEFWDWSNSNRKSEILDIRKQIIQSDKDNFNQSLRIQINNLNSDIDKYESMLSSDRKMINLQKSIVDERKLQLENGTSSSSDYFNEQNALLDLELNQELHKLNVINSKINLLFTTGNY